VLELRWSIAAEQKRWEEGLQLAQTLLRRAPKRSSGWLHQAYALRRISDGGLQKAWEALLPAFDKFPKELTIPFNLSCYACQLGQLDAARDWLKRAVAISGKEKVVTMALSDPDLEPLWDEIRQL
jgi:tetratricopeptide (TPR) repeat protein